MNVKNWGEEMPARVAKTKSFVMGNGERAVTARVVRVSMSRPL
jgi:hypothetical protein